jgi:hypothetical protein
VRAALFSLDEAESKSSKQHWQASAQSVSDQTHEQRSRCPEDDGEYGQPTEKRGLNRQVRQSFLK